MASTTTDGSTSGSEVSWTSEVSSTSSTSRPAKRPRDAEKADPDKKADKPKKKVKYTEDTKKNDGSASGNPPYPKTNSNRAQSEDTSTASTSSTSSTSGVKKRAKGRKGKKKLFPNGYMQLFQHLLATTFKGWKATEVAKIAAVVWGNMSTADKKKWEK